MINIDKFLKLKLTYKELNKINTEELELTFNSDFSLFNAKVVEEAIVKYCYGDWKLRYLSKWIDIYYEYLIYYDMNMTFLRFSAKVLDLFIIYCRYILTIVVKFIIICFWRCL